MVVMMGKVEKLEPIPMVTINPTTSMASAAKALLAPKSAAEVFTRLCTSPVALITAAKPWAVIMMKPIIAIIFMPWVNTSSAWRQLTAPVIMKIDRPTREPTSSESASDSSESITTCTAKVATIAIRETITL